MRILFVDEILGQWVYERSIAQRKAQGASTLQLEIWECTSERDLCGRLEKNSTGFDVIASSFTPITRDVLSRLPHPPKVIVAQGTGRNHIDAAACEAAGAVVIDNAGWCASEVAEYLLFALGSLALNVKEVSNSMENGEWARNLADRKVVLRNKVLGIVGCGAIGQQLLRNARGVGMKVAFYDSYVKTFDGLESTKTLDGLLETADHLAVCIPLTSSTRGLLDIAALRKLKNGFLLVNAARGGVLCESALLEVLHDGTCAGAALDVFESEPLLSDSPLRNHPRIIVSPHIAGKARESEERAASAIVEKLSEFFGKLGEELGGDSTPVALGKNAFTSTKLSAARHASVRSATVVPSSVRTMRDIYDECCRGTGVVNLAAGMVELDPPLRLRQYASELALETQIHSEIAPRLFGAGCLSNRLRVGSQWGIGWC
ncbi:D-isomer specific 2-hydroxyacid dehydrogenase [Phlyctochytrium arcticum]|nr:D-isomer specific 2-hydroxyacid dehydrogenase [Phlyctochytrium arcticum]